MPHRREGCMNGAREDKTSLRISERLKNYVPALPAQLRFRESGKAAGPKRWREDRDSRRAALHGHAVLFGCAVRAAAARRRNAAALADFTASRIV
jgi:hypothetical protein